MATAVAVARKRRNRDSDMGCVWSLVLLAGTMAHGFVARELQACTAANVVTGAIAILYSVLTT
jgi:hypothetical protein